MKSADIKYKDVRDASEEMDELRKLKRIIQDSRAKKQTLSSEPVKRHKVIFVNNNHKGYYNMTSQANLDLNYTDININTSRSNALGYTGFYTEGGNSQTHVIEHLTEEESPKSERHHLPDPFNKLIMVSVEKAYSFLDLLV